MKTILAVDDSATMREMVAFVLESAGYRVIEAEDGAQGLDRATSTSCDLVITDQNMPNMTGLEMLTQLGVRGIAIPTLLITGSSDAELARQALDLGVMKVLEKPMSPCELLRFISFSVG